MKTNTIIVNRLKNKAKKSNCTYKISAIGFNYNGEMLGSSNNTFRFNREGGGLHAEMNLINRYGKAISYIIICRIGSNCILPIHPCKRCQKVADKLNIKIYTVTQHGEIKPHEKVENISTAT